MLSVILPNFNHGRLIDRAVSALLEQKLLPDEIIVIDDASTDDSLAIITRLAAVSPRIRVILNEENVGVVKSQNAGLEMAREPFVYFAAADDWVLPGFFELAVGMLEVHPYSGLFCGESVLVHGVNGSKLGTRPIARPSYRAAYIDAESVRGLLTRTDNWILTGATVFRRTAVLEAGGFNADLGAFADGYLARKIALTHGFIFSPTIVSTWRIFPAGVSRATALDPTRAKHLLQIAPEQIQSDPVFPKWYGALFQNRWRFAVSRVALDVQPVDRTLLLSFGALSSIDSAVFRVIWRTLTPSLSRTAILGWLWFRLRPMSLFAVLRTAISRRFERWHEPA